MNIDSIMLEITRKCNLRCSHCLRGAAQKKSMGYDVMYAAITKADNIRSLSFGGGEPSLAAKEIKQAAYVAQYSNNVDSFFLVTNGRYAPSEFIEALRNMYVACNDNEGTSMCYSDDQYHDLKAKPQVLDKIREAVIDFGFTDTVEDQTLYPKTRGRGINDTIIMGRSRYGHYLETELNTFYFGGWDGETDIDGGLFYVNVDGDVFPSCDLSYKAQRNPLYKLGNVLDPDFNYKDAAVEWNRRVNEGVVGEYFYD